MFYTASGWSFVDAATTDYTAPWTVVGDGTGPVLGWQYDLPIELPVFSGGSGTSDDPYLIATADDLNQIGHVPELMDKHFLLTADIVVTGPDHLNAIGDELHPFTGVFDGDHHRLDIQVPLPIAPYSDHVGLFGYLDGEAHIRNLTLSRDVLPEESAGALAVGGLAGYVARGTIERCHWEGTIAGQDYTGGLVGYNAGHIIACSAVGIVAGEEQVGGLVAYNGGTVAASSAACDITGRLDIGGLVGHNEGEIRTSLAFGSAGGHLNIGGLVGDNSGQVAHCYSTAFVDSRILAGGLIGKWPAGFRHGVVLGCSE